MLKVAMAAVGAFRARRIDADEGLWPAPAERCSLHSLCYRLIAILPRRWPVDVKTIYTP